MIKLNEFALESIVGGDCTVGEAAESFVKGMEKPFNHMDKYEEPSACAGLGSVITICAAITASIILHEIIIINYTKIKNKLKQY